MERAEAQVGEILDRCARRRRAIIAARALQRWSERSWPGLALLLGAAAIARFTHTDALPVAIAAGLWLLATAAWTFRARHALSFPGWVLPAYVDRHGGARGALMQALEQDRSDLPVPARVREVALPRPPLRRSLTVWALLGASAAVVLLSPLPEHIARAARHDTPAPVLRTDRLLEQVRQAAPEQQAFVKSAREALKGLAAQKEGLDRSDFEALERIDNDARRLLRQRGEQLAAQREALQELDALLARQAEAGKASEAAGTLGQDPGRMLELMQRAGLSKEQIAQMQQGAGNEGTKGQRGKAPQNTEGGGGFQRDAVEALRKQIGELRRVNLAQGEQLGEGQQPGNPGGAERGPGVAPLELTHQTAEQSSRYDAQGFRARKSERTVMLASGTSKRGDRPAQDSHGQAATEFESGTRTELWDKRVKPRHRAVLRSYFGGK